MGAADCEPVIRKALALGGDEAYRVNTQSDDSFYIATQIFENLAKQGNYDLIFTGKTIDYNGSSMGNGCRDTFRCLIFLWQQNLISTVQQLLLLAKLKAVKRFAVALPVVVSCQKGVAEQRIQTCVEL